MYERLKVGHGVGAACGALALLAACPQDPPIVDPVTSGDEPPASTGDTPTTGEPSTTGGACTQIVCVDGAAIACAFGIAGDPQACPALCVDGLGCVACEPDAVRCGEAGVERCDDLGEWAPGEACNPDQGFVCDPAAGACTGPCAADALAGGGHLGCEFYAVSLARSVFGDEVFGVLVTNPGDEPATLVAEKLLWTGTTTEIPPHTTVAVFLPWTQNFLGDLTASKLVGEAAVHLQSDRPVAVVQHSPMMPAGSSDASLLLPVHAWGEDHRVASMRSIVLSGAYSGIYAVVAARDGTTVELSAPAGLIVLAGDGVGVDGAGTIVLDRGDVLQVAADMDADLTGAGVRADGPIQVFGGHRCAQVPFDVNGCDHLEEVMPPSTSLGLRHAVVPPVTSDSPTVRRDQVVRIIATENLTTLEFDPPLDLPTTLVYAGDWIEVGPDQVAFVLDASAPVLVAQYMVSKAWDDRLDSDPSLTIATSVEHFREDYLIHASPLWPATDVDVVAPQDAAVTVDGVALADWTPIGASGLAHAHVRLAADDAVHAIAADRPIGASVYAAGSGTIGNAASYWHPAGPGPADE